MLNACRPADESRCSNSLMGKVKSEGFIFAFKLCVCLLELLEFDATALERKIMPEEFGIILFRGCTLSPRIGLSSFDLESI